VNIEDKQRKKETERGRKNKYRNEAVKAEGQEVRRSKRNEQVIKKQGKKQRENREKWEVIYTDDVQVETNSDICDVVTSPRDTACLWIFTHMAATPLSFILRSHPSSSFCSLHAYKSPHTFIHTCVHAVL